MKNRIAKIIATIILASVGSAGVYNYTGVDIVTPDGETFVTHDLPRSVNKFYSNRSVEDSLYITIHHTAMDKNQSLESIAKFHVEQNGWAEIAYHVAIDYEGNINFLNFPEERTYHDSGENTRSIGVVVLGNYEVDEPTEEIVGSLKLVTDALCKNLKIKGIRAHRDTSPTLCCGTKLYNRLQDEGLFY